MLKLAIYDICHMPHTYMPYQVVVVGDGAVGKTCLCTVYTQVTLQSRNHRDNYYNDILWSSWSWLVRCMNSLSWFQFLPFSWGKILSSVFYPFLSYLCFLSQMYGSDRWRYMSACFQNVLKSVSPRNCFIRYWAGGYSWKYLSPHVFPLLRKSFQPATIPLCLTPTPQIWCLRMKKKLWVDKFEKLKYTFSEI